MRTRQLVGQGAAVLRILPAVVLWCFANLVLAQSAGVVSEVTISGNKNISQDAILTTMRIKVGQPFVQAQLDQDKEALDKMGFFQAVDVHARELEEGKWSVAVDVTEYPKVKEIRVTGNDSISTAAIVKVVTIKPGTVFNRNSAESSIAAIRKLYSDKGYPGTLFDHFEPAQDSPGTVLISIVELKVHQVTFTGNVKTKDRVMKRLIHTRPGDTYNLNTWIEDLKRIHNTQWFESEKESETLSEEGTGQLDLGVAVKEARTGQFNVGAQLDPRQGLAGFIKVGEPNFQGTGQDVSVTVMQQTTTYGNSTVGSAWTSTTRTRSTTPTIRR